MEISHSERRLIENEMIFRGRNEKVKDDLFALDAMLIDEGNTHLVSDDNLLLYFICECSDENCVARIPLEVSEYQELHADRDTFVVKPNHDVTPIEKIVKKTPTYIVVKKNHTVPEPSGGLHTTSISNT